MTGSGLMDANTDTLTRVVQMAMVVVQEIEGHRGKLEGEVNSVIPAQWSMDQSQALLGAHKKWDMAIRNLCQKLEKLGEDTNFAMNDYIDVDQQGASCFNGVDSSGSSSFGGGGMSGVGGLGGGFGSDLGLGGGDSGFDFGGGDGADSDSDSDGGDDSDGSDDDDDGIGGGGGGISSGSSSFSGSESSYGSSGGLSGLGGSGESSGQTYAFAGLLRAV